MDLIERQAAIEALCSNCQGRCVPCDNYPCSEVEVINALPSAQSEPCADAVSRADVINFLCDWICAPGERCVSDCKCLKGIRELPSVMPVRDCTGCRFSFLEESTEDG